MADVALVYQPAVEPALPLARATEAALARRGCSATLLSAWDLDAERPCGDFQFVVTFGGDGTILEAARWIAGQSVPIIGVQMGRLGFLAEVQPADMPGALDPYLDGDFWLDRRSMIAGTVGEGDDAVHNCLALNDIVLGRGQSLRTVTVDVSTDGSLLHRFRCDGVIVASATGSTAYSFAAGGPVLTPDSSDLVITAICPHISSLRSFVVPGDVALRLRVWTSQPAVVTVDGQIDHVLQDGGVVHVQRSDRVTTFARRGTRAEFYCRVLTKLD